jgi:CO/xanthine dehydrogenase Mo-binding subunit
LWTSNQMIAWGVGEVAKTLGIPPADVRLISPYIGGGFGSKLFVRTDAVLAALGRAGCQAAGQGRIAATADDLQQHDPSAGDHSAPSDRRDA